MLGYPAHIPTEFKGDGLGKGSARSLEGNKRAADNQSVDEVVVLGDSKCIIRERPIYPLGTSLNHIRRYPLVLCGFRPGVHLCFRRCQHANKAGDSRLGSPNSDPASDLVRQQCFDKTPVG